MVAQSGGGGGPGGMFAIASPRLLVQSRIRQEGPAQVAWGVEGDRVTDESRRGAMVFEAGTC